MRINRYIASNCGVSRRQADTMITSGRVTVNGQPAQLGQAVEDSDQVSIDSRPLQTEAKLTLLLNKPAGYVVSRRQQGETPTIYRLLPSKHKSLKPVGRLDKDSSGLLLLTNDGELAQKLTHPSYNKEKVYRLRLNRPLNHTDLVRLNKGVELKDGLSRLKVSVKGREYEVRMSEGRNRQIRRTFAKLGYRTTSLCRLQFGDYTLGNLKEGGWQEVAGA